jgi:basic amino acid/polyamine antiporter, APA family
MRDPGGRDLSSATGNDLRRVVGFWGGTALIVGITIGSGIFRKPQTLAGLVPDAVIILALWAGFGLVSLCGALALAELATLLPRTGGPYVFIHAAYGPAAAFVFGWLYLLVATPAAIGALTTFGAELLLGLAGRAPKDLPPGAVPAVASLAIVLLGAANLRGARVGSAIQGTLTVLKVSAIVLVTLLALFVGGGSFAHLGERAATSVSGSALGRAAASVIWAYDGWIAVSMIAGEIVAAERQMRRIVIAGMLGIVALYLGANVAYFYAMPVAAMAEASEGVPQRIATSVLGPGGGVLVSLLVLASVFGAANGNVLAKPRVSYALARDGLTFAFLGRAHPRFATPHVAIVIQTAGAVALVWVLRDFDRLTTYYVVVEWAALLFAVGALFVLRRTMPDAPRPFRAPGYPWVPLAFLAGTLAGLIAIVWGEIDQATPDYSPIWGLLVSVAGFPAYKLWRAKR